MSVWHRKAMLDQLHGVESPAPSAEEASPAASAPAIHPSLVDHARNILAGDPALTDEHRAALWSAFHDSRTVSDLARKLSELDAEIPPDTQEALLRAKKLSTPAPDAMDRVFAAMTQMDPKTLELAEGHPEVLRVLADAVKGKD